MLGTGAQARAELCNRTQSNIMDIQRLFDDVNINLGELEEYIEKVDDRALVTEQVPSFPAPSKTDLNFLKPGSQEVLHRKSHIEHYLPPMYPELEKVSTIIFHRNFLYFGINNSKGGGPWGAL